VELPATRAARQLGPFALRAAETASGFRAEPGNPPHLHKISTMKMPRARERICSRNGALGKTWTPLLGDLGKLSRASIGENGDAVTLPEFGQGKLFLTNPKGAFHLKRTLAVLALDTEGEAPGGALVAPVAHRSVRRQNCLFRQIVHRDR
jgi:hypothetical protein